MGYSENENLGETEKILLLMHNLSIVHPEIAWTSFEIAKNSSISEENLIQILKQLETEGYVKSYSDAGGAKRYYLTSMGIIKISTEFT